MQKKLEAISGRFCEPQAFREMSKAKPNVALIEMAYGKDGSRETSGFHALNTALVFLLFRRMTGATWRSVILAAFAGGR